MSEEKRPCTVELLPPAQRELEEIALLHRELSGVTYAKAMTDELFAAMERLALFPLSAPLIREPELRRMGFRYVTVRSYLLFYRPVEDRVYVYHIVHGKTDYPTLLRTKYL